MHPTEMSHWLWTWVAWEKANYGLTVRASDDTGLHMRPAIATVVIMRGLIALLSVNLGVANQLKDGKCLLACA